MIGIRLTEIGLQDAGAEHRLQCPLVDGSAAQCMTLHFSVSCAKYRALVMKLIYIYYPKSYSKYSKKRKIAKETET